MRKIALLFAFIFALCVSAFAQVSSNPVRHGTGAPSTCTKGRLYINDFNGDIYGSVSGVCVKTGTAGPVAGPASSTDNAIVRFDGTSGKTLQNSAVTIADTSGNMVGVGTVNTHTIPGGTDTFALLAAPQALTGKTYNGLTITTSTGTFTLTSAKIFTVNNSLTLAGTDGTTMTFPTTSATIARTDAQNVFTGHQTIEGVTSTGATGTGKFVFDTLPTLGITTISGTTASSQFRIFDSTNSKTRFFFNNNDDLTFFNNGAVAQATFFSTTNGGAGSISVHAGGQFTFSGSTVSSNAADAGIARGAAAIVKVTNGSSGYGILDASGLRISNAATSGNYLRGDGTNFVSSPFTASDITGTTTNDNAAVGKVGEYTSALVATGSAVSLTTTATSNVTSASLTAGDWDCTGQVDYVSGGGTVIQYFKQGSSSTSTTLGAQDTFATQVLGASVTTDPGFPIPTTRFSLASTTIVYLVANASFTVSTLSAYGSLRCRRIR